MQHNEHVWTWCYIMLSRESQTESYLLKVAAACW